MKLVECYLNDKKELEVHYQQPVATTFGEEIGAAWKDIYVAKDGAIVLDRTIHAKIIPSKGVEITWPDIYPWTPNR